MSDEQGNDEGAKSPDDLISRMAERVGDKPVTRVEQQKLAFLSFVKRERQKVEQAQESGEVAPEPPQDPEYAAVFDQLEELWEKPVSLESYFQIREISRKLRGDVVREKRRATELEVKLADLRTKKIGLFPEAYQVEQELEALRAGYAELMQAYEERGRMLEEGQKVIDQCLTPDEVRICVEEAVENMRKQYQGWLAGAKAAVQERLDAVYERMAGLLGRVVDVQEGIGDVHEAIEGVQELMDRKIQEFGDGIEAELTEPSNGYQPIEQTGPPPIPVEPKPEE
jgi:chromosome segregation ATPase